MRILKYTIIFISVIMLSACDKYDLAGFFGFVAKEHVNKRFEQSIEYNNKHIEDTLITTKARDYKFYVAGDFHVIKETTNLINYVKAGANDTNSVFTAILGDITDRKGGLEIAHEAIEKNRGNSNIKTITGNHDLFFDQWHIYYELYGSSTYYFVVKSAEASDLFIMLESGSGTFGKDQTKWLEKLLKDKRKNFRHCIVMTHTNFFDTNLGQFPSGNYLIEETAAMTNMFSRYDIEVVITGHDHTYEMFGYNGVTYLTLDAGKEDCEHASYFTIDMSDEIEFNRHAF